MTETFNVDLNQDNNDELDNIKIDKETIAKLKERFPEKMDEIFEISKEELDELKTLVNWTEKDKQEKIEKILRKNLIEDDVENKKESWEKWEDIVNLDTISLWANSEQIDKLKIVIESSIAEKIKDYNLKPSQELNISVWITAKILESSALMKAFSWIWDIANKFIWNLQSWQFEEAFKWTQNEVEKLSKIKKILEDSMTDLLKVLKENEKIDLENLLSNPKAIAELKEGDDLSKIKKLNNKELTDYLLSVNEKVLNYDKKIEKFENMSNDIISAISKSPEYMQKVSKKVLEFLLKIPFIWGLLAALLGYNNAKDAIEWFWEDLNRAKATNNLISHWKNEEWINTNSLSISLLEGKDLTWLKFKKLKPFFITCKNEWIDYTAKDFWYKLFNKIKDPKDEKFNALIDQFKIEEKDFDSNKKPTSSFYEKLNWIKAVEKKKEVKEGEKTELQKKSTEQLKKDQKEITDSIIKKDDFVEKKTDTKKLGETDMKNLEDNISLWDLLSTEYKEKIKEQIITWSEWMDSDYEDISKYIESIRDRLKIIWKVGIEKITWKKIEDIKFEELLNEDSDIYKEVFKIKELGEIGKELKSRTINIEKENKIKKEKEAINSSLKAIDDWIFTEFKYEINGKETKIKFDKKNQEIIIWNISHKINIKYKTIVIKLSSIVKNWENLELKAWLSQSISKSISVDKFAEYIYDLKTFGEVELKDKNWNKLWNIKQ